MIDLSGIPKASSLIDEALREQLNGIFSKMPEPVVLKAVVDMEQEKDSEMASFLHVISELGEQLSVELYTPAEAAAQVPELDTAYLPVTGLYKNGEYRRVTFHGVPGGKEINSFVIAVLNLSGGGQEVPEKLKKRIGKLKKKANIKICVSLSCHHCPAVVAACQQIAILNPGIEAEMIDAALYPELVKKFNISRVPMMITNDRDIYMGSKTIEEIVNLLKF
ncbi:MAG: thioredoxin family protein [Hungatella sp.]|jgi:thioredoxin reductase (NADPH)|nr:thioredoxin family protein [Hungatella sp.]